MPCQRLEAAVLASETFVAFASGVALFVYQRPEDELAGFSVEKGVVGFPTILIIDGAGDVVATHTGSRTVAGFEATLGRARVLEARLAKGEAGARIDVLIGDLEAGRVKLEQFEKRIDGLGQLTKDQERALEVAKANGEIDALCASTFDRGKLGKKLLARYSARKPAPTGPVQSTAYWYGLLEHAEATHDAALYAELVGKIKAGEPALRFSPNAIVELEKTLERLRK